MMLQLLVSLSMIVQVSMSMASVVCWLLQQAFSASPLRPTPLNNNTCLLKQESCAVLRHRDHILLSLKPAALASSNLLLHPSSLPLIASRGSAILPVGSVATFAGVCDWAVRSQERRGPNSGSPQASLYQKSNSVVVSFLFFLVIRQ